jgi:hypothetical protein
MDRDGANDDVLAVLRIAVGLLERGDWRAVLRPPGFGGCVIAGPRHHVRLAVALHLVARSMQLQAQGSVDDAWGQLGDAAAVLPGQLFRRDASTGIALAVLVSKPPIDMSGGVSFAWRIARLVWREQVELEDLRCRVAPGRVTPRDELIEACIQHLFWVEFDPFTFYRAPPGRMLWDDGTTVDRLRSVLCGRGSRLRQFADPTAGRLSQAVWQDIGGYRGLCAAAFDRLAVQSAPARWCGTAGSSGLTIRRGRLRAWQHACRRRDDLSEHQELGGDRGDVAVKGVPESNLSPQRMDRVLGWEAVRRSWADVSSG